MRSFAFCGLSLVLAAHVSTAADARAMTNGSNVRLRRAPEITASIDVELPLGTELLVLGRSNAADPWLRVRTDAGREGWVLGRLTTSVESDHYEQTVETIVR